MSIISVTYSALIDLINANDLTPGQQYMITDYRTTYLREGRFTVINQPEVIPDNNGIDRWQANINGVLTNSGQQPPEGVTTGIVGGANANLRIVGFRASAFWAVLNINNNWINLWNFPAHQTSSDVLVVSDIIEPLIVTAVSSNRIGGTAISPLHPDDTIYYDINARFVSRINRAPAIGETRVRPGIITRRVLAAKNIDIFYDWRNVLWDREVAWINTANPTIIGNAGDTTRRWGPSNALDGSVILAPLTGNPVIDGNIRRTGTTFRDAWEVLSRGGVWVRTALATRSPQHVRPIPNTGSTSIGEVLTIPEVVSDVLLPTGIVVQDPDTVIFRTSHVNVAHNSNNTTVSSAGIVEIGIQSEGNHIREAANIKLGTETINNAIMSASQIELSAGCMGNNIASCAESSMAVRCLNNRINSSSKIELGKQNQDNVIQNSAAITTGISVENNDIRHASYITMMNDISHCDISCNRTVVQNGARNMTIGASHSTIGPQTNGGTFSGIGITVESNCRSCETIGCTDTTMGQDSLNCSVRGAIWVKIGAKSRNCIVRSAHDIDMGTDNKYNIAMNLQSLKTGPKVNQCALTNCSEVTIDFESEWNNIALSSVVSIGRCSRFNTIINSQNVHLGIFNGANTFRHCENVTTQDRCVGNIIRPTWGGVGANSSRFNNVHFDHRVCGMVVQGTRNDYSNIPNNIWSNPNIRKDIYRAANNSIWCMYIDTTVGGGSTPAPATGSVNWDQIEAQIREIDHQGGLQGDWIRRIIEALRNIPLGGGGGCIVTNIMLRGAH